MSMSNSPAHTDLSRTGLVSLGSDPDAPVAADASMSAAAAAAADPVAGPRWNLVTRVAFRFSVLYLVMYCCTKAQIFNGIFGPVLQLLPFTVTPPSAWSPVRTMANHIAISWWGYAEPVRGWHQGGGDKPYDWALNYGLVLIALAGTALWSAIDWKRVSYPRLHAWFRLFLRLAVGSQMVSYGLAKAFPMQMPYPGLIQMLTPYGNQNLMGVLWSKIGASPAYEMFTGFAELLAGVLLIVPGVTTLGALIGIPVTFQVWMLNMTYDVPVKNLSLHLLIMCGILLLPEVKQLATLLVLRRPAAMWREPRYFKNRTAHRAVVGLQLVLAAYVLYAGGTGSYTRWQTSPYNQPKSEIYGIWTIDRMTIDGVERAPLLNDYDRWQRIVIDMPHAVWFQRMNGTFTSVQARIDVPGKAIRFTTDVPSLFPRPPGQPAPPVQEFGQMTIERPAPDKLVLDGTLHGKKMRLEATYSDPQNLRLRQAKFRWIQ